MDKKILFFFIFFMLRPLKKLILGDMIITVAGNLAISEGNLCRGSTKKAILKNFTKFEEKELCWNLF